MIITGVGTPSSKKDRVSCTDGDSVLWCMSRTMILYSRSERGHLLAEAGIETFKLLPKYNSSVVNEKLVSLFP